MLLDSNIATAYHATLNAERTLCALVNSITRVQIQEHFHVTRLIIRLETNH
jgi:hypothetical protein